MVPDPTRIPTRTGDPVGDLAGRPRLVDLDGTPDPADLTTTRAVLAAQAGQGITPADPVTSPSDQRSDGRGQARDRRPKAAVRLGHKPSGYRRKMKKSARVAATTALLSAGLGLVGLAAASDVHAQTTAFPAYPCNPGDDWNPGNGPYCNGPGPGGDYGPGPGGPGPNGPAPGGVGGGEDGGAAGGGSGGHGGGGGGGGH